MRLLTALLVSLVLWIFPMYQSSPKLLGPHKSPPVLTALEKSLDVKYWTQDYILWAEGGYYDFEDKYGGPTNKGITWSTFVTQAKLLGISPTRENFENLKDSVWQKVFDNFWELAYCDSVDYLPLKATLMDFAWGSGHYGSMKHIQRCLNKQGFNLKVDGVLGRQTRRALKNCDAKQLTKDIALVRRSIADNCKPYSKGLHNRLDVFEKAVLSNFMLTNSPENALHERVLHSTSGNKASRLFHRESYLSNPDQSSPGKPLP